MLRQSSRSRPSFWAIANVLGVLAIALLACLLFSTWFRLIVAPASLGDFGEITDAKWRFSQVVPGGPAARAGIKIGDQVVDVEPSLMRFVIGSFNYVSLSPGDVATVVVERGAMRRVVTLRAQPLAPMRPAEAVLQSVLFASTVIFVAIGAWLVLLRPTLITWSLYLLGASMVWGVGPSISQPFVVAQLYTWQVIVPTGVCGLSIFSLRFPSGVATGWRRTAEIVTYFLVLPDIAISVYDTWWEELGRPYVGLIAWLDDAYWVAIAAMCIVAAISLVDTYRTSNGLERQRISWVVIGLTWAAFAIALSVVNFALSFASSDGWIVLVQSTIVVFPITVAYAVVRHRVIDVRFVVGRALVVGVIGAAIVAIVIAVDWLFSTRFADSPAKTAVYAGIGVAVGLSLNTARRRVGSAIDALFFKRWHAVNERVEELSAALSRASTRQDAYGSLTSGIAETFTLASCALFERLADGGFIRVASLGWPRKTLWHLLPDDPVTTRTSTTRPVHVEAVDWHGHALPVGVARPSVTVPIVVGKDVAAFVLCGAHVDGTAIDPDEVGAIRKICSEASFTFASGGAQVSSASMASAGV